MDNFESFYSNTALELRWFLISKYFPIIYSGLSHQTNILSSHSLSRWVSDTKNINKNQHKSSWLAFKKDLSVVAWGSRARWEKIVYNLSSIIQSSARNCITTSVHFATHGYVTNTRHSVVSITLLNTVQDVVTFVNEQRRQPARNCRLFTKFANKSFRAACKKSQCV